MITFENERFHLHNKFFSYVIEISRGKYLFHRYWGRPLKEFRDSAPLQAIDRGFSGQLAAFENERTFSLDVLPQEYPVRGHTDFASLRTQSNLKTARTFQNLITSHTKFLTASPN